MIEKGDEVEIVSGMLGGRRGSVTWISRNLSTGGRVIHVRVEVPELITRPEGPTRLEVLPYGEHELVAASAEVPA